MKRIIPVLTSLFVPAMIFAQTIVPGGLVSGTWTKSGSPYLVQGNLVINNAATLTIQPGVTINFQGSYRLLVSGRLLAAGTQSDSIRFTATDLTKGWEGIRFDNTASSNDSSRISYCSVQYRHVSHGNGAGIYIGNFSKISITHSTIANCSAVEFGGGNCLFSSDAIITDNIISFNHSDSGGQYIASGSPLISDNYISNNDDPLHLSSVPGDPGSDPDNFGAGVSCNSTNATIISNTSINNTFLRREGKHGGKISVTLKSITRIFTVIKARVMRVVCFARQSYGK